MYEVALRNKFRFNSPKGLLTIEDLWDLPLQSATGRANLDDIARGLFKELKGNDTISFVDPGTEKDTTLQAKFDIVKPIIDGRVAENTAASEARVRTEKKQKLLAILAKKEDETLEHMSPEDLRKAIAEL